MNSVDRKPKKMRNKRKLKKNTHKSDDSHPENLLPRCPVIAAGEEEEAETSPISVVMYPKYEDFIFTTDFALTVLNFYNYKNHSDFELVEALGDMGCLHSRRAEICALFHCSFKARSSSAADGDSSTKIFHAELFENNIVRMVVNFCHVLQDNKTGCEICDNKIFGSYRYCPNRILQPPSTPLWLSTDKAEKDDIGIAKLALQCYNDSYHTDYEFLRYEASSTSIGYKMISHVNFFAKPKGVSDNRSSSKLFFAESEQTYECDVIRFCCILEGETNFPCSLCKAICKDVFHPLWGGWCGGPKAVRERGQRRRRS